MRNSRLLLSVLPALLLLAVAASVIWGDNGLLVRHQLHGQLTEAQAELAELDRANERTLRELRQMDADPVLVERRVADELGWGHEDAILVRFEEPATP
jgi:cell division protein FtsB